VRSCSSPGPKIARAAMYDRRVSLSHRRRPHANRMSIVVSWAVYSGLNSSQGHPHINTANTFLFRTINVAYPTFTTESETSPGANVSHEVPEWSFLATAPVRRPSAGASGCEVAFASLRGTVGPGAGTAAASRMGGSCDAEGSETLPSDMPPSESPDMLRPEMLRPRAGTCDTAEGGAEDEPNEPMHCVQTSLGTSCSCGRAKEAGGCTRG
jgi:hypothetical protein